MLVCFIWCEHDPGHWQGCAVKRRDVGLVLALRFGAGSRHSLITLPLGKQDLSLSWVLSTMEEGGCVTQPYRAIKELPYVIMQTPQH